MPSLFSYLPSVQFSSIAGSIALAAGLVVVAQYVTAPEPAGSVFATPAAADTDAQDWRTALEAIQATAPSLPEAPSENTTQALLAEARNDNFTDTVARSLLVNLSDANAQGLGGDTPTQEKIIADALAQAPTKAAATVHTSGELHLVADTKESKRAYGNAVMTALGKHPDAASQYVLYAVSVATDNRDSSALAPLKHIAQEYGVLIDELSVVAVPKTLGPLHVQILNDFETIVVSLEDLQQILKDPLRGLKGLQAYQLTLGEVGRVLTAVAENLNKNGILFTKDEPGTAWSVFTASASY